MSTLSNDELRGICEDRFEQWKKQFIEGRATPIMVIGIFPDTQDGIIVSAANDAPDYMLLGLLAAAHKLMLEKKLGNKFRCDNCLNTDTKRIINAGPVKVTLKRCHLGRWGYFAGKAEREAAADTCGSQLPVNKILEGGR